MGISFPIGYEKFHRNKLFNYQMNRWYTFGWALKEELFGIAGKVHDFKTWKDEFAKLGDKALKENRPVNAAFYYRSADFFTLPGDPDKETLYDTFSKLFYENFGNELERHNILYGDTHLPAIRLKREGNTKAKGTIIVMGGFDSYIEEFYMMMRYLADAGYEVIGFEGPGQGAALKKSGLLLDIAWEKPLAAVLDYFKKDSAILFGISMGGYWSLRAAAFEKRIEKVIASSVVYDWMDAPSEFIRSMVYWMFEHPKMMNASIKMKMKLSHYNNWVSHNWMYITGEKTPLEATRHILDMNAKNLHSDKVTQDVLILTGENDNFCPLKLHYKQVAALTNSMVTDRIFTKEEHADSHCQVGNIGLAMDTIVDWLG